MFHCSVCGRPKTIKYHLLLFIFTIRMTFDTINNDTKWVLYPFYVHTNNVRTARRREAPGRLTTILPVWPTSTCTSSYKALRRAHLEEPTFSGQQAAPTLCLTPSRRVGRLLSGFPPKLLRKPRYGVIHITTKKPWGDPDDCPHHQYCCLGME